MAIIEVKELTKKFGGKTALNKVSFSVSKGEAFAILGPNGAGKTTLTKILSTLIRPTSGNVNINGHDIAEEPEEVKRQIGVVSHNPFLYDDLTAEENLRFYADLYDVKAEVDALLEKVDLLQVKNELVGTYSRGMKQRLSIARCLLHNPDILILDEPSSGLDIASKRNFHSIIKELNSKGATILLTTHQLGEAEELCNKVCILQSGEVRACGNIDEIRGKQTLEEVFIRFTEGAEEQ